MLSYAVFEALHQILATIHIIVYFICLAMMFSLFSFSEHPFKQENK